MKQIRDLIEKGSIPLTSVSVSFDDIHTYLENNGYVLVYHDNTKYFTTSWFYVKDFKEYELRVDFSTNIHTVTFKLVN